MREELRSLPGDLAELVGRHLVAAERALEEDDPDRAHEHTKVARRFAARIGVVREAAGIVAYRAGHYSEALSDLRAARRMTGSDAYLPVMADCERGLGRPERALDLVRSPEAERLDRPERIELAIVESGARRDLGQNDAAVITLQRLPELRDQDAKPWSARLAFAYADALLAAGHQEAATDWFARAMAFDGDGETDAAERYAMLTGAVIDDLEEDYEDGDDLDVPFDDDIAVGAPAGEADASDDFDDSEESSEFDESEDSQDSSDSQESEESEEHAEDLEEDVAADAVSEERPVPDEAPQGAPAPTPADSAAPTGAADPAVSTGAAASAGSAGSAAADEAASPAAAGEQSDVQSAPDINLAFIEPDFGDILDESPQDKSKRED
ncbi:hypothetical protein [Nonomuraea roseoviolacea]|uniref:Tetratricopeptide (TPR) repeat protein n=2 Tax=Nonomuraea TaxID=83681 RepID=A0ABT1K9T1_9ACTN|nr:hypothetical protein [Nonomuraea roseoviolacea]MCP2350778.1 tetratricopeptide (TPR) repeat protein [Nonomuraea roseoviolacea subsp. carminata]